MAGLLLGACVGENGAISPAEKGPVSEPVVRESPVDARPAGVDQVTPDALGMMNGFIPKRGLTDIQPDLPGFAFRLAPGAKAVEATLEFMTLGDYAPTHILSLLNFRPIDALGDGKGGYRSHVVVNPEPGKGIRIDVKFPVETLRIGNNCLLFVIQEDPAKRVQQPQPTQATGRRVDIVKGGGQSPGKACAAVPEGHPGVRTTFHPVAVGLSPEPWLAVDGNRMIHKRRMAWEKLDQGRVYVRYSNASHLGEAEDVVFLVADGEVVTVDGKPFLTVVPQSESREAHIAFSLPRPAKATAVMAVAAPAVNRSFASPDRELRGGHMYESWQMVVSP